MKNSVLYNFLTSLMVLLCISCAHQGSKMAAMDAVVADEDLAQETSNAPSEAVKQEKELATLEAPAEEALIVAKNDVAPSSKGSSEVSNQGSDLSSLEPESAKEEAPKKADLPKEDKAQENTSKVDEQAADDVVASMLDVSAEEKSVALEEIKKVDVAPAVVASSAAAVLVASEDQVNADIAPAEAVGSAVESLPAPGHERELSNDSKLNEPAIETEPVPAPAKKSPRKQGSENKTKKNRIETVDYSKGQPKKPANLAVVSIQQVPAKGAVPAIVKAEKKDAKLASAEIADFVKEHYLLVAFAALLGAFAAFKFARSASKPDDSLPL